MSKHTQQEIEENIRQKVYDAFPYTRTHVENGNRIVTDVTDVALSIFFEELTRQKEELYIKVTNAKHWFQNNIVDATGRDNVEQEAIETLNHILTLLK